MKKQIIKFHDFLLRLIRHEAGMGETIAFTIFLFAAAYIILRFTDTSFIH